MYIKNILNDCMDGVCVGVWVCVRARACTCACTLVLRSRVRPRLPQSDAESLTVRLCCMPLASWPSSPWAIFPSLISVKAPGVYCHTRFCVWVPGIKLRSTGTRSECLCPPRCLPGPNHRSSVISLNPILRRHRNHMK